jgi:hypothetical protein
MKGRTKQQHNSQPDYSDLVCKVLSTIDYLKICADHHYPTGNGIPLDIAIMPDFVVDVDGAAINLLNNLNDQEEYRVAAAEIGSRAGRVLSILAHLRDRDDEGFQLRYIAKTGRTGLAVLKDRLEAQFEDQGFEPVRFPYIVPTKSTRFTVLGRETYDEEDAKRHIVKPKREGLLREDELLRHFYNPKEVIRNSNALYFATDALSQFKELINGVVCGDIPKNDSSDSPWKPNCGFRFVFIDLAAIHLVDDRDENADGTSSTPGTNSLAKAMINLDRRISEGDAAAKRTRLVVIVNGSRTLFNLSSIKKLFRDDLRLRVSKDLLVVYNRDKDCDRECKSNIRFWNGTKEFSSDIDPTDIISRDAFVAGLVLYRAVASAWTNIPRPERFRYPLKLNSIQHGDQDWTQGLFPDPFKGVPTGQWIESKEERIFRAGEKDQYKEVIEKKKYQEPDVDKELDFMDNHWSIEEMIQFGESLVRIWSNNKSLNRRDRRAFIHASQNRYDCENCETIKPNTILNGILALKDPRSWYKYIVGLDSRHFNDDRDNGARDAVIENLWLIVTKSKLMASPAWNHAKPEVIDCASWDIIRAMVALRALRHLSRAEGIEPKCLKKNAAYLTDLDGTLLQSSKLREMCLKNAFLAMLTPSDDESRLSASFPVLPPIDKKYRDSVSQLVPDNTTLLQLLSNCSHLYDICIYKQADLWMAILDKYPYFNYGNYPRDFRQVWNHRLSYPVFLWVLLRMTNGDLIEHIRDLPAEIIFCALRSSEILELFKKDPKQQVNSIRKKLREWFGLENESPQSLVLFNKNIANLDTKNKRCFDAAAKRYWDVYYEPFRHTRECLSTLRDVLGVRLYVATEGHHETQLNKIAVLDFERFFPEMTILSTDAAASTHEDLRNIQDEKNFQAEGIKHRQLMRERWAGNQEVVSRESSEITILEKQQKHLRLFETQWENFQKKENKVIYPLIVTSIMVEPESPFLGLTDLNHIFESLDPTNAENIEKTYFAMTGDRENKDIAPIIDSCRGMNQPYTNDRVTTVRLLTMDHSTEDVYWIQGWNPRAQFLAWTPLQTLICLTHSTAWSESLDYHTIPAIMNGRLADITGNIDKNWCDALVWGQNVTIETLQRSVELINLFVLRGTIRDCGIYGDAFITHSLKYIVDSRKAAGQIIGNSLYAWDIYTFLVSIMERMVFELTYMPRSQRLNMPNLILRGIIEEFHIAFGGRLNPKHDICEMQGINILRGLSCRLKDDNGALCNRPSPVDIQRVQNCVNPRYRGMIADIFHGWPG